MNSVGQTNSSLGILGGGQLAQMLALAALPLGVPVRVLEPDPQAPARLCSEHLCAPYTDDDALDRLADCAAVTLEFENVPLEALEKLTERVPIRPSSALLYNSKHRAREKMQLRLAGASTAPFVIIEEQSDLADALQTVGGQGILKTSELGYDGKGQVRLAKGDDLAAAWQQLGRVPCVLEGFISFERELSLAVARSVSGQLAFGPLVQNTHRDGILRTSLCVLDKASQQQARRIAKAIAEEWQLEGLLTIEFFELPDGELVVNEVAPRVHNSGHLTQDGGGLSQFEAQVRAVLDMPLSDWQPLLPCAMVNIVGADSPPNWQAIARLAGSRLHLYHKEHRLGRKLGHVNLVAPSPEQLLQQLDELECYIP